MILIVSTYYNNPHFVEYQVKSFNKYLKEPYDFVILNDARRDTRSIISGKKSQQEIEQECKKYNVKHILVPPSIHHKTRQTAGARHQGNLNWYFCTTCTDGGAHGKGKEFDKSMWDHKDRFNKKLFNKYDYVLVVDADVFLKKPISFEEHFENNKYTYTGPKLQSHDFTYPHIGFMAMNLKNLTYEKVQELNFWGTNNNKNCPCPAKLHYIDSGGCLHRYFVNNPDYKIKWMNWNDKLFNYLAGSDWNYRGSNYHKERTSKLNEFLGL